MYVSYPHPYPCGTVSPRLAGMPGTFGMPGVSGVNAEGIQSCGAQYGLPRSVPYGATYGAAPAVLWQQAWRINGNTVPASWPAQPAGAEHPVYGQAEGGYAGETRQEPDGRQPLHDYGPEPFVVDIEEAAKRNDTFRTALWTGNHLQLTLMSIPVGGEIGLERHDHLDQFIRIEEGDGLVEMGRTRENLSFRRAVEEDDVILIPAGTWHNVTNTGRRPIKLYSIYAPPAHPRGTVHRTKQEADAAEHGSRDVQDAEAVD